MWLLECVGDVFHGRKLWLRPGKKFIFGRTLSDAAGFAIANKTISRKHLIIEITSTELLEGTATARRSRVTLQDLDTKIGTLVDQKQIRGQSYVLNGDDHVIKLGHFENVFKITWNPVVFTYSFSAKELRGNPLESLRERLEHLDITVLGDYVRDVTTHVVVKKRNTPKGLQALINGKYIVDPSFVDSIVDAAKASENAESSLEADFEANWPDPLQHLPPRGQEPTDRPSTAYLPDLSRREIFDGYTFVFYDQAQFDNLLAPITNGKGKALVRPVDPKSTLVDDFVRHVKEVAGEKGLGEFEDGSEGKGVVVVKFQPAKGTTTEWFAEFGREISQRLDHRLIEQSEFLDAILNNDPSILRKPLEPEQSGVVALQLTGGTLSSARPNDQPASTTLMFQSMVEIGHKPEALENSAATPAPPPRKFGKSRRTVTSRFKGFDDDFDFAVIPQSAPTEPIQSQADASQQLDLFVSQAQEMEVDDVGSYLTRKRQLSPIEGEEDDILEQFAPAAASLKRRRLAEEVARRRRGESTPPPPQILPLKSDVSDLKPKKTRKQLDVLEVARQQREKEDELARVDREALLEAMKGIDIDQIRNIAVIEEMEVKRSMPTLRTRAHGDEGERWDERWNGRKNFKKFRRRGEGGPTMINKVIVPLEEVKRKDFGIGDEYWLEGDSQRKKKGKGRQKETQVTQSRQTIPVPSQYNETADPDDDIEIVDRPTLSPKTVLAGAKRLADKTNASRNLSVQGKRPAAEGLLKAAPTKKARPATTTEDSDSEDGLGFRFRKRT